MDNQKTHMVGEEFFEIFLLHAFRLIGPQTKQGNMQPCTAKIGLSSLSSVVYTVQSVHVVVHAGRIRIRKHYSGSGYDEAKNS
jgi:hypothetical protein